MHGLRARTGPDRIPKCHPQLEPCIERRRWLHSSVGCNGPILLRCRQELECFGTTFFAAGGTAGLIVESCAAGGTAILVVNSTAHIAIGYGHHGGRMPQAFAAFHDRMGVAMFGLIGACVSAILDLCRM